MPLVDFPVLIAVLALGVVRAGRGAGENRGVSHGFLVENDAEYISDIYRRTSLNASVCSQIIGLGKIDLIGAVDILPKVHHFCTGQLQNGVVVGVAENPVGHLRENRRIEVGALELLRGVPHDNAICEIGVELDRVLCHQIRHGVDPGVSPLHKVSEILRGIDSCGREL